MKSKNPSLLLGDAEGLGRSLRLYGVQLKHLDDGASNDGGDEVVEKEEVRIGETTSS